MDRTRTVRNTTFTTSTTSGGVDGAMDGGSATYRESSYGSMAPITGGRTLVISRTTGSSGVPGMAMGGSHGATRTLERSVRTSAQYNSAGPMPNYAVITATGVSGIKESRDQEKKDMQDLNERFASYIDKVRNLEAQNRKLAEDLSRLKEKWGKDTIQVKAMFQVDLDECRHQLDEAEKEKARLEIRIASHEEELEDIRQELALAAQQLSENQAFIAKNNQYLIDFESEIQGLRKRIEQLENEKDKDKKNIVQLKELLAKARQDLDNETLEHINAENRCQTLQEEIDFLKSIHDLEMKELAALICTDSAPERNFWKTEMAMALREIQDMYDEKFNTMRTEMETQYTSKVQEYKTGVAKAVTETQRTKEDTTKIRQDMSEMRDKLNELMNQNAMLTKEFEVLRRKKEEQERDLEYQRSQLSTEASTLRFELDRIMQDLRKIMDSKLGLELEIAAYRKLLEGEENRLNAVSVQASSSSYAYGGGSAGGYGYGSGFGAGGAGGAGGGGGAGGAGGMVGGGGMGGGGGGGAGGASVATSVVGQMSAKTTYHKSALGPISISNCTPDGKLVELENTGTREENIENWKIVRSVDGKELPEYRLDGRFSGLKRGQKIGIYARGQKPRTAGARDIEVNFDSWGIGAQAITKLINPEGEEKATHTQKTIYSS